jgi:hypothetical protein
MLSDVFFAFIFTIVKWETGTGIAQFSKRYGLDEWGLISREDTGVFSHSQLIGLL